MKKVAKAIEDWKVCPNPDCVWHRRQNIPEGRRWYRKHGYYYSAQHGMITRYICLNCNKTFSERSQVDDFYLHYDKYSILEIGRLWMSGQSLKEIAKKLGITVQMVRTRLRRFPPYALRQSSQWDFPEFHSQNKSS